MIDYDSPWKEAMDRYFELFMLFFFPRFHVLIDWTRDYESLDSEFRKLSAESETGKRHVDKLVRVYLVDGGDRRLAHVELQGRKENDFELRLHTYNYRIEDVHKHPVWTLVVLADEDPHWRPREYRFEEEGCVRTLSWPVVKLLDYQDQWEQLATGSNLFGCLVVAHLVAQRTRDDPGTRTEWKLRLLLGLHSRKLEGEDVRQWSRYFDWLLPLDPEEEADVLRQVREFEKENDMPYVTSFERLGRAEGRAEGEKAGLEKGLEEGLEKGLAEGLCQTIAAILELRFGVDPATVVPLLGKDKGSEELKGLVETAKKVASLEAFRAALDAGKAGV